jgi:hypothetical protein
MIRAKVEFSEGTYKTLWNAILKTGDKDLLDFWKEQVRKETIPVLHYTIIKEYLNGFLFNLTTHNNDFDSYMILNNCHKEGYHKKHYGNL